MGTRSLPLGKISITDDDGHEGIGRTREEAEEALREAQEKDVEYVETGFTGVGTWIHGWGKHGPKVDRND